MRIDRTSLAALLGAVFFLSSSGSAAPGAIHGHLAELLAELDQEMVPTGILYDRVLSLSALEDHDGHPGSPPVTPPRWRQMVHELGHASLEPPTWPDPKAIRALGSEAFREGVVPLAVLSVTYDRIRPEALEDGTLALRGRRLVVTEGDALVRSRAFAVTALKDDTYRGDRVVFILDPRCAVTNDPEPLPSLDIDFADGRGFRTVRFGERCEVRWDRPGLKEIRVRARRADGSTDHGNFSFHVRSLRVPSPDDTVSITATIPYEGQHGTGEAYVYLADGHASLTNPIVVVEGFDLENSMNWEELYELLNQEGLLEILRARGFDAVVLNFTEATDYLQRNAYVLVELIQQVNAAIGPSANLAVVGASMGGLVSRYALATMESQGLPANVRTLLAFDSPETGANIPLGLQYWLDFFSETSTEAEFLLSRLDTPGARQMLLYHHTSPPAATGESDSLRTVFLSDLAALGQYPVVPRKVAIANGSGDRDDQGFAPGDQIVSYEYQSLLVDVIGNIWAVPDGDDRLIFHGLLDFLLLPPDEILVSVSGTLPYDGAPGGFRGSMAQMDSTEAPFGDIVALHDDHCFIPTISALSLDVTDPFHDIAGDPDLPARTPFDVVYFPAENQPHVTITPQSVAWFLVELSRGATSVASALPSSPAGLELLPVAPNPFRDGTELRFRTGNASSVAIDIHDVRGRRVRTLLGGRVFGPGLHSVPWDATDGDGMPVASGVYFYRVRTPDRSVSGKLLRRE
jgi:hypothetical protein